MEYRVVNPTNGEAAATARSTNPEQREKALSAAATAGAAWRRVAPAQRADVLLAAAQLMRERRDELAAIVTAEIGKPREAARDEVELAARIFEFYGEQVETLLADQRITSPTGAALVRLEAMGVILGIMPWNFPYYQVTRFVAPNLLLGNAVLLKPAPACPESAAALETLLLEAGLPDGVYATMYTTDEETLDMVADDRVCGVSLTGSERAGRAVAEVAGRSLKKCVLELGGSDALIVLDRESLASAAMDGVAARMANSGQVCTSPKRMIVLADLYDDFVVAVERATSGVTVGDPTAEGTAMGPLATYRAAVEVAEQVSDAVAHGARLRIGDGKVQGPGAWLSPVVLTDVTPEMRAWDEEIFGPVVVIHRAEDEDDAVRIANATRYGLSASLYGRDREQIQRIANQLDVGMVFVNSTAISVPELPFGGTKSSGFGRELGEAGLREFANAKLIHEVIDA